MSTVSHRTATALLAFVLLLAGCASPEPVSAQPLPETGTFVHPGALNNEAELQVIRDKLASGDQPWNTLFKDVRGLADATTNTTAPTTENGQKADGRRAYANALAWSLTKNPVYAKNGIGVLNLWAQTFAGYSPVDGQNLLQGAWIGALFGPAAELLRDYPGWKSDDKKRVKLMFQTAFYPVLNKMSTWNGNVDLTQIDAMMSIAVFCGDQAEFNLGLERLRSRMPNYFYLKTDGERSDSSTWFSPLKWVDGLTQETCRDNGHHAQYALASALHAAEVAWHQGVDVYAEFGPRFTSAMELLALQVVTGSMQGVAANDATTSDLYNTWEVGYNHYHNRMGLELPHTEELLKTRVRLHSQSDWNIFYETLTHHLGGQP